MAPARLHLPLFILIGLYTGARKEAILSLRWSQVDLTSNRIDFKGDSGNQRNNVVPGYRFRRNSFHIFGVRAFAAQNLASSSMRMV